MESSYVERFLLEDSSSTVVRKTQNFDGHPVKETLAVSYLTSCVLSLTKTNHNNHCEELLVSLQDHEPSPSIKRVDFQIKVKVEPDCLVSRLSMNATGSFRYLARCTSNNPDAQDGGVLMSSSYLYWRDEDERKGLVVVLVAKRKDGDNEKSYLITLRHYIIVSSEDTGLCVVTKIRKENAEDLKIRVEKPVRQHKDHMLSMFNEVIRTGWKPNYKVDFTI